MSSLRDVRHQVVRDSLGILSDLAGWVCTNRIEISQEHATPILQMKRFSESRCWPPVMIGIMIGIMIIVKSQSRSMAWVIGFLGYCNVMLDCKRKCSKC